MFKSLETSRDFFDLSLADEFEFASRFFPQFDSLSRPLADVLSYFTSVLPQIDLPDSLNRRTKILSTELNRVLAWAADAVYIQALLQIDLMRMAFGAVDDVPVFCLPLELINFRKAGSGTFSDVWYTVMPTNAIHPLVAVKRLKLTPFVKNYFHMTSQQIPRWKQIEALKMHELKFLRLIHSQHIVGLAVDDASLPFDTIILEPTTCTWKDVLQARPRQIQRWFLTVFAIELFHGLLVIHKHDVLHCDLKPSNVHFLMDLPSLLCVIQAYCFLSCCSLSISLSLHPLPLILFSLPSAESYSCLSYTCSEDRRFWECSVCPKTTAVV
jgi:hypothetical protein